MQDRAETAFSVLMAGFVVVLVLSNIIGVKLFLAFPEILPQGFFGEPITLTTGIMVYPLTFLVKDIVSEFCGRRWAGICRVCHEPVVTRLYPNDPCGSRITCVADRQPLFRVRRGDAARL